MALCAFVFAEDEPEFSDADDVAAAEIDSSEAESDGEKTGTEETPDGTDLDSLLNLVEQDPGRLNSVDVQGSRGDVLLNPDQVFNPDTSSTSNSVNSTGELLSQSPSVIVRRTSALNQDARVRGYSGSQVVGAADGVYQLKTRLDVDSLFSQIDPNLVESLSVIAGPYAVEYGPGFAFLDARLIAPGRSAELQSHSKTFFGLNTNGQQLMWRETASFSDQRSGALVSIGQRVGNDYKAGRGSSDFRVPASYHVQDYFVSVSHDVTDRSRMDYTYLRQVLNDTELPGVAYDIRDQHSDQLTIGWSWKDDLTGHDRFQSQFWWNQAAYAADASNPSKQQTFFNRMVGAPYPDALGGTLIGNGLSDNWGARFQTLWGDPESWQGRTGVDWRRARQFYREQDFQPNGSPALLGDTYGIPDSSSDDFGIFASGSMLLSERWSVGAGQRLDAVIYGVNSQDEVATSTQFTPNGEFAAGFNTSPRVLSMTYLNTNYRVTDAVTAHGGVAYAMRAPNVTELYSDQPFAPLVRFGNSFALGDSELDPEQNLQFDLGFTARVEKNLFAARMFHSTIQNYIGLAANNYGSFPQIGTASPSRLNRAQPYMADPSIPNQDLSADSASLGYSFRNLERAELYGFELLAERPIRPWLELIGTLAFTQGVNHDPTWIDVYTGQVNHVSRREGLPGIYPLNSTVTIRFVEPTARRWTIDLQGRFAAEQQYLATSLGEIGTPGFDVYNIHAHYRWSDQLSIRMSLLNVLDRNYYEHNSLAIVDRNGNVGFVKDPGLSWFTGLEYKF